MLRIIIVEDNVHKQLNIKETIINVANIKEDDIILTNSVKDAKKLLYGEYFDLMILDLVLPIESGEDSDAKNGVDFLNTIHSSPMIKPPIHIIGMSEFSDQISLYSEEFRKRLWHLIDYKADSAGWQDQLANIIYHLVKTRERYLKQRIQTYQYDIAVITALTSPELEAVLRLNNGKWEKVTVDDDISTYYKSSFSNNGVTKTVIAAAADQMGMTAASHLSTKMILFFRPKYIIMAGIAAGIKGRDLGFGDILIAEQSWDYGSGKMVEKQSESGDLIKDVIFEPDLRPIQLSADLKSKINACRLTYSTILNKIQNDWPGDKPPTKLQLHLGPIATGSYVISTEKTLDEIKRHQRKLLGVEMETYGVYYSAEHSIDPKSKAISIKSVSDFGDGVKNDKYQRYAAYTSATFLYHFILNEL